MTIRLLSDYWIRPFFAGDDDEDSGAGASESKRPSVEDIVSQAMENYDDGSGEAAPETEPETEESAPSGERVRGPDGRFTRSTDAEAPDAQARGPAKAPKPAPAETPQPAPAQSLAAPEAWRAEDKASFAKLPADAQRLVLDRHAAMQADYTRKTQEIAEYRRRADPILQVTERYGQYLHSLGRHPAEAVNTLLYAEHTLRTGTPEQKTGLLAQLCVDYNINPAAAYQLIQQGHVRQPIPLNPQTHYQLQQSEQRLAALEARNAQYEQAQNVQAASAQIAEFWNAKNPDGTPKYPSLERVKSAMGDWLRSNPEQVQNMSPAQMLETAYGIFGKPIDDAVRGQVAQRTNAANVARARAGAAVRSVNGSGTAPGGHATPRGASAHVAAAMAKIGYSD